MKLPLGPGVTWNDGWDIDSCRVSLEDTDTDGVVVRGKKWLRGLTWRGKRVLPGVDRGMVFEQAPAGFQCEKGQKVAILVCSFGRECTATPETVSGGHITTCTQAQLDEIYGYGGGVAIYSGEITAVGQYHIETNINTYKGCSGAIIFLLDGEHRGKAIAVHVGYHPLPEKNIGLKLAVGLKPGAFGQLRRHLLRGWFTLPPIPQTTGAQKAEEQISSDLAADTAESSDSIM